MPITHFMSLPGLPLLAAGLTPAHAAAPDHPVLVIGALHDLHEREPAFGYDQLRAAIRAFMPDILVLEVRPDELDERKPTPGRPEYPAVIWPLLAETGVEAVAMEPGGEAFKVIAGEAGAAFDALGRNNPDGAAALSRLGAQVDDILLLHWQRAGQVQDDTTASLTAGVQAAQFALAGSAFAAAQARWDGHMSARMLDVVRANPGKRVMVIGSYKNRAMLQNAAQAAAPQRVINASQWFEKTNPAITLIGKK